MKNILTKTLLILTCISAPALSAHAQDKIVTLKPDFVFTPKSFDSNDNAQIVIAGNFTGYCMKMGSVEHRIDLLRGEIYLDQTMSVTNHCKDLEMYIPYSNVVNIGPLPAGSYDVMTLNEDGTYSKRSVLPIAKAMDNSDSNGTDEHLYAPLNTISFKVSKRSADPILTISGVFTNSCLALSSFEVSLRGTDVLEVLPLVKPSKLNCKAVTNPFTQSIVLKNFPATETLIHVRAMNGQSFNKVITNLDRIPHM